MAAAPALPGPGLDHGDFPSLEQAFEKAGAADGLDVVFPELPQDGARLDLKGGDDDGSGRRAFWHAAGSVGKGIRLNK